MHTDALSHFDLIKRAADQSILDWIKNTLVGSPREAWSQLQSGQYLKPNGIIRRSVWADHPNAVARWYRRAPLILAGATLPLSLSADERRRGSSVGGALGRFAGTVVGVPFGQLGQLVAGGTLGTLGSHIGHAFDKAPPPRPLPSPDVGFPYPPTYTSPDNRY